MKWVLKPEPDDGEVRYITRFLFIPSFIGSECRWLETATIKQVYVAGLFTRGFWDDCYFVDDDEAARK